MSIARLNPWRNKPSKQSRINDLEAEVERLQAAMQRLRRNAHDAFELGLRLNREPNTTFHRSFWEEPAEHLRQMDTFVSGNTSNRTRGASAAHPDHTLSEERTRELLDAIQSRTPIRFCGLGRHDVDHDVEFSVSTGEPTMAHFEPCGNSVYLCAYQEDQ